jgi:hypothetical protein
VKRLTIQFPFSYPLAYSLIVLPITIARWSHKNQNDVPSAAFFFGQSTLSLSGAINVLLLLTTRPKLLLFDFAPAENPTEVEVQLPHVPETERRKRKDDLEERSSNFTSEDTLKSETQSFKGSTYASEV